jgi:TPP-dependent pyruvate/acetoin dehydrogenase alpha subunit
MAELFGKKTGCCRGQGGSMHMFDREFGLVRDICARGFVLRKLDAGLGRNMETSHAGSDVGALIPFFLTYQLNHH